MSGRAIHLRMSDPSARRAYDHRLRDLVRQSGHLAVAKQLGVPRSTALSWVRRGPRPVVTAEVTNQDAAELRIRVLKLERRVQRLLAMVRLLFTLARIAGLRLQDHRLPSGDAKRTLLRAVGRATQVIPLAVAFRVVGVSPSRFRA